MAILTAGEPRSETEPRTTRRSFLRRLGASGLAASAAVFGRADADEAVYARGCCNLGFPARNWNECKKWCNYTWRCLSGCCSVCRCCERHARRPGRSARRSGDRRSPRTSAADPEAPSKRQTRDPHRRTAAARDRETVLLQRLVHRAEPGPGTHGRLTAGHRSQGRDVDDDPSGRRPPREAVPPTSRRVLQAVPANPQIGQREWSRAAAEFKVREPPPGPQGAPAPGPVP
jgi:hypothetical protein